ncbi:chemokine XC receptor 1-like protein [Labeo rohita]|uniref:Chemokine XC receptor 1-like protein n=1 Tax=Labeo rohita TaxID=84645 RepID=A0A498MU48_LABRO|nr:chemokine XC receptor 1-like protein [Labeo rohita]
MPDTSDYYDYDNQTSGSYGDDICIKKNAIQFGKAVTPIIFIIVVLFSCVGNTLVLWVLVKYENLKSLTNTFLLNLALSDLIFTFGLPFWAYYYMHGWTLGDPACKAVNFVFYTGYYSSIIFLTVLTVHRYMAVVHPMSVVMSRKSLHCYATSIVIWIISFCAAIPQASGSYDDDICLKKNAIQFGKAVTPIIFIIVVLFSCVGNTLVVWVLVKYENLKSLTNTLLLNLALSDLIFTFGLPFWAYYYMYGWTLGDPACKAINFVFYTGYYSSIIILTVLTIHRYMAVVHPMSVVMSRKSLHCYATSIVIWIISLCAAIPQASFNIVVSNSVDVFMDAQNNSTNIVLLCDFDGEINWKLMSTYMQNSVFIITFVIIAFCYTVILRRLLRPTSHTRKKTVQLILFIVVFFFLGWGPYNVAIFLDSLIAWSISPFSDCEMTVQTMTENPHGMPDTSDYYDYDNQTSGSYDDDICLKKNAIQFGKAVTPIIFIIVVLFSCVGNTLVLWVLVKYENLKSLTNTLLLNLALSDLIFTFGLPFWAYYYMYGWTLGDPACKAVNFVFYTGYYSSIIILTVLTVHRYMAVVHPMSVVMSRKSLHYYATSIVIWIISLCAAIPQARCSVYICAIKNIKQYNDLCDTA